MHLHEKQRTLKGKSPQQKYEFFKDVILQFFPLSNFQIYSTVVLTVVTLLYMTFLALVYLITGSLNFLTIIILFPTPISCNSFLGIFRYFCFYIRKYMTVRLLCDTPQHE